jgi:phenylacetate-CoA ligase
MENVTYWRKNLETMPREKLEEFQLHRFKDRMKYVYEHSPMYRRKYEQAGIKPHDIRTLADIQYVPFTLKEELLESQAAAPPWGDFICIPPEEGVRVFQTSGTTGIPLRAILNQTDWSVNYYEQFMHFMYGYGIKKSDILFVPFNYGLYIAWWGFSSALQQEGVMIVPGGGQSSEARIKNIFDWEATVVCGTPTYMLYLGELAAKMGTPLTESKVRVLVVAGEPGAQVPSTKKTLADLWGAKVYDDIGSTEATNWGYECVAQKGTHLIESMFYAECLDMDSLKPVPDGEIGELVLSNLTCESMPLIRYRIKDLVRFNKQTCECGRTFLRLDGGVLGRSDDMFQFAGVNIFPSAIENMIREVEEFSSEFELIVPPKGSGKHLRIRVEPVTQDISSDKMQDAIKKFINTMKFCITVTPQVEIASIGELTRFEGKAKRVKREQ